MNQHYADRQKDQPDLDSSNMGMIIMAAMFIWCAASWLTHVIVCVTQEAWGFLIAGAIMPPIGIVHGTGVLFGAW